MPLYDYWCTPGRHELLEYFSMSEMPPTIHCAVHDVECRRSFQTQGVNYNDQFRSYYLSDKGAKAATMQGRPIAGPRDKHEAKEMERATGRCYIGDDVEKLSERSQRAVAKRFPHNEKGAP
jgi:hypothetical protein